jgi:hypothetical protein
LVSSSHITGPEKKIYIYIDEILVSTGVGFREKIWKTP